MVVKAIPAHVWPLILSHLRKPIPPPFSAPTRNALGQSALCTAAVVCKLWHEISIPLLYTHIATDQIGFCLSNLHHPSDRRLFAHTRSLYIEYSDLERESSYQEILHIGEGVWGDFGVVNDEEAKRRRMRNCKTESLLLIDCLENVNSAIEAEGSAFPRLETLAILSIYDTFEMWYRYGQDNAEQTPDVDACLYQFNILLRSLNPVHLCLRATSSPLSLPTVTYTSLTPMGDHSTTIHVPGFTSGFYPRLTPGRRVRWVYGSEGEEDWGVTVSKLEFCLRRVSTHRKKNPQQGSAEDIADIEIFSSSNVFNRPFPFAPTIHRLITPLPPPGTIPRILSQADQEGMVQQLGNVAQALLRRDSGLQDRVFWRTSAETPWCKACGAGPPA